MSRPGVFTARRSGEIPDPARAFLEIGAALMANNTTPRSLRMKPMSSDMDSRSAEPSRRPSHQEICDRAYQLYLARGGRDGLAEQDWFAAEAELTARGA